MARDDHTARIRRYPSLAIRHRPVLPFVPPGMSAYDCFAIGGGGDLFEQTATLESFESRLEEAAASDNAAAVPELLGPPDIRFTDSLAVETSANGELSFSWQHHLMQTAQSFARTSQGTRRSVAEQWTQPASDPRNTHVLTVCADLGTGAAGAAQLHSLAREWISIVDPAWLDLPKGASQEVIDGLPTQEITLDLVTSEEPSCAVCLANLDVGATESVTALPCGHLYHRECIVPWLQQQSTCPVCRCEIEPQRLHEDVTVGVQAWRLPEIDPFSLDFAYPRLQEFVVVIHLF